jgi:DNA recombination protein RmuC
MLLAGLLTGIVAGGAGGAWCAWTYARARCQREVAEIAAKSAADIAATGARLDEWSKQMASLEQSLGHRTRKLEQAVAESSAVRQERARIAAELDAERKAGAEKLALLAEAQDRLRESFASLSSEALRHNNESFLELAKASMGEFQQAAAGVLEQRQTAIAELVKPIRESLDKVDTKLHDVEQARVEAYAALREQVRTLGTTQQHLQSETANLVKALRTPNVRGRWGEIQLRNVIEMAGMLDHCDFREQRTHETEEGRIRPDVIVRLPGSKQVVVDAKAPMMAYLQALESADDDARDALCRDHARQVREHVTRLSAKSYWSQFEQAPDFVVMFLPGEAFFLAALEYDHGLIEWAMEQRVLITSPMTLIALLRSAAYGWRQEQIAENAQQISRLGRELYERLLKMSEHFEDIRKGLDRTVDAYNRAAGSFEGRVLVAGRRFKELGATSLDELPQMGIVERAPRALQALPVRGEGDEVPEPDAPPAFLLAE